MNGKNASLAQAPPFALPSAFWAAISPASLLFCWPGGIYEVAVIAIFFDLDPEFVSFHHIIRLLMILFLVPLILKLLKKT